MKVKALTFNIQHGVDQHSDKGEINLDQIADIIKDELKNIEIIESLLFLSMIPLHSENSNHQFAMLATGLMIMSRWINIKKMS